MISRTIRAASAGLFLTGFSSGCAHLPIDHQGVWTGPLPERSITVTEAARVSPPWYGRVFAPFLLEILSGGRVGLEYNEGRTVRASEYIRGIPIVGWITVPYWCFEALTNSRMQAVANKQGIDSRRQRKYDSVVKRLDQDGRTQEAQYLRDHSPFDPANHPSNPLAQMPPEHLRGFKNKMKIGWVELTIGHRIALERNESRGLRKIEYWHPLLVPRFWEAFEAAFGRRMEDIAEEEHLDERWLPKSEAGGSAAQGRDDRERANDAHAMKSAEEGLGLNAVMCKPPSGEENHAWRRDPSVGADHPVRTVPVCGDLDAVAKIDVLTQTKGALL